MSWDPWRLEVFGQAQELVSQVHRAAQAVSAEERLGFLASSESEKLVARYSTLIRGLQALVASPDKRV